MDEVFGRLLTLLKTGQWGMLVTVTHATGSTPRGTGAAMVVQSDGTAFGTIGGGNVEFEAQKKAVNLLAEKKREVHQFRFVQGDAASLGMVCGGDLTVYFQPIAPACLPLFERLQEATCDTWFLQNTATGAMEVCNRSQNKDMEPLLKMDAVAQGDWLSIPVVQGGKVYIFGGGHVCQALVPVLQSVGFAPVVFDDRAQFTDKRLFPNARDVILGDFGNIAKDVVLTPSDAVVVMTRGHQADYEVLSQLLGQAGWYFGCIGSKTKLALCRARLLEHGIAEEVYEKLHAPIGLPLGGRTPEEIAISVVAELIAVRQGTRHLFG